MRRLVVSLVLGWSAWGAAAGPAPNQLSAQKHPIAGKELAFPRITEVGLLTADPTTESEGFLAQCRRHAEHHLAYCRLHDPSLAQVYVSQGHPGGLDGNGTPGLPFLVDPDPDLGGAQLKALIEGLQLVFPMGSAIWLEASLSVRLANGDHIALTAPNTHVRAWDPTFSGNMPTIHKWRAHEVQFEAVTQPETGRVYYKAGYDGPVDARFAVGEPTPDPMSPRYREHLFLQVSTLGIFEDVVYRNNTNVYFIDTATQTLYMHLIDDLDPGTLPLQVCDATSNIFRLAGDGTGLEGLHLNGGDQANSSYVVKADSGGNAYFVVGCFLEDSFKHVHGLVGALADGSVYLSMDNWVGGGSADTSGFTHLVAYADDGHVDFLSVGDHFFGSARGPERSSGRLLYSHSKSSIEEVGSIVIADFSVDTYGWTSVSSFIGVSPGTNTTGQIRAAVGFDVVMDVKGRGTRSHDGQALSTTGGLNAVRNAAWCPFGDANFNVARGSTDVTIDSYVTNNDGAIGGIATTKRTGTIANVHMRLRMPTPTGSVTPNADRANGLRVQNADSDVSFHNCTFIADYAGGTQPFTMFWHHSGTVRFYGCTFLALGPGAQQWSSGNAYNAAPIPGSGAFECGWEGFPSSNYAATMQPRTLVGYDPDATPLVGGPLGVPWLPLTPRHDAFGVWRDPAFPTIGARAPAHPAPAPAPGRPRHIRILER